MINLKLNKEECERLSRILAYYKSELRAEIADTDLKDFRDNLKEDEVFLNKILDMLKQGSSS